MARISKLGAIALLLSTPAFAAGPGYYGSGDRMYGYSISTTAGLTWIPAVTCVDTSGNATGCSGGGGGGGSNAAAFSTGATNPTYGSVTDYLGSDNVTHHWVGDATGHPAVSIFGTPTIANTAFGATQSGTWNITNITGTVSLPTGAATAAKQATLDTNGDARLPTVTVTPFYVSLAANTSTTILAASAARIGFDIQCAGTAAVGISRTGATLSSATPSAGGADLVIPASSTPPYFTPAYNSKTSAITGYTGTAQACWGVSYAQQ